MFWFSGVRIRRRPGPDSVVEPGIAAYLADSYPPNHNYRVTDDGFVARRRLARRYRRIASLYPQPLTSLLDVACSKGFFVLAAADQLSCRRALGIDVCRRDLDAAEAARNYLNADRASFCDLRLHELADEIEAHGGPFQTVLMINCYPYFYYGSSRSPDRYLDHREIFRLLRRVCADRLIFSNRTELDVLPEIPFAEARATGHGEAIYNTSRILAAADEFFEVSQHGRLSRSPLWCLRARPAKVASPVRGPRSVIRSCREVIAGSENRVPNDVLTDSGKEGLS